MVIAKCCNCLLLKQLSKLNQLTAQKLYLCVRIGGVIGSKKSASN
jgi:hypothetical protein